MNSWFWNSHEYLDHVIDKEFSKEFEYATGMVLK